VSVDKAKQFLKDWTGKVVRSAPFQAVRDTALNVAGLDLHEKLFLQSMTGGRRDGLTQLPEDTLGQLKGASRDRDLARMGVEKVAPWMEQTPNDFPAGVKPIKYSPIHGQAREGDNLDLYGRGAELHMGLGNVQATTDDSGNVRVRDIWDVDHAAHEDAAIAKGENPLMGDLVEGGPLASRIYHFARRLGTYEPINVDVNIPAEKWKGIEGEAAPESYPTYSRTVSTIKRSPENVPGAGYVDLSGMPPMLETEDGNLHDLWNQKKPLPKPSS